LAGQNINKIKMDHHVLVNNMDDNDLKWKTGYVGDVDDGYRRFLNAVPIGEEKVVYSAAHGDCQGHKSMYICRFIELSLRRHHHVLISSTGLNVHRDQLKSRVEHYFQTSRHCMPCEFIIVEKQNHRADKQVKEAIKSNKLCVFFTIETAPNVEKFGILMSMLFTSTHESKHILFIHDEADLLHHVEDMNIEQVKVQQAWKTLVDMILINVHEERPLRRFFVSATLENCFYYFPIQFPISLPTPPGYTGWREEDNGETSDIVFHPTECKNVMDSVTKAYQVYNRMRLDPENNYQGIVLVATKVKTNDHEKIMCGLVPLLADDAVICIHNGDGIKLHLHTDYEPYRTFHQRFEPWIATTPSTREEEGGLRRSNIFVLKNILICDVYEILRVMGVKGVITIGYRLMDRGVTHVSNGPRREDIIPLTAIRMIVNTGSRVAVQITQVFHRIAGCAQPGVKRHIYAPSAMIDTFTGYMKSQKELIPRMTVSCNTQMTMQRVTLKWFPGWLERKTLVACNNIPKEKKITSSPVEREIVGDIHVGALRKYWIDMQRIDLVLKDNASKPKYMHIRILKALSMTDHSMSINELGMMMNYKSYPSVSGPTSKDRASFESNIRNGCQGGQHAKPIGTGISLWHQRGDKITINYAFKELFQQFAMDGMNK